MPTTPQLIPAVNAFLLHLKIVKQASEHTVRNYAIDLSHFKRHLEIHLLSLSEKNVSPSFSEKGHIKQGPEISFLRLTEKTLGIFWLVKSNKALQNVLPSEDFLLFVLFLSSVSYKGFYKKILLSRLTLPN